MQLLLSMVGHRWPRDVNRGHDVTAECPGSSSPHYPRFNPHPALRLVRIYRARVSRGGAREEEIRYDSSFTNDSCHSLTSKGKRSPIQGRPHRIMCPTSIAGLLCKHQPIRPTGSVEPHLVVPSRPLVFHRRGIFGLRPRVSQPQLKRGRKAGVPRHLPDGSHG